MYGCTRSGVELSKITLAEGGNQMGCGIEISDSLYNDFHCYSDLSSRISLKKGSGKASGTAGNAGKVEGSGNLQNLTGGSGGAGGTTDSTDNQGVAMEFMYVHGIITTPPTGWPSNVPYTMTPKVLDYQQ